MKTLKLSSQWPLFTLTLLIFVAQINLSNAASTDGVHGSHSALAHHYEALASEAKEKLQKNQAILKEYEAHPYYYGRQGQDLLSHTIANIREYERIVQENLKNAELHKKMAAEPDQEINKAELGVNHKL